MQVDIEGMIEIDLDELAERILSDGIEELAEQIDCGEVAGYVSAGEVADNIDHYNLADHFDMENLAEHVTIDQEALHAHVSWNLDYALLAESIVAHMSSDNLLTLIDELSAAHATMYRREEE